jgi:D-3-phosphoglycerate dehydrogenase
MKILIADKLSKIGLDWLKAQEGVEIEINAGLPPAELGKIVGKYDAMIIRSGVKVTAEVLENPGQLKVIARAGVGVDNVDVPVATQKGVIVMNTPGGNTLSTAELALTLMMALSRKIAPANASVKRGEWDRKSFAGAQLAGKTLGVIGLGRIGMAVAQRAVAMEMRVLGYDPFFAGTAEPGMEVVKDLAEICKRSDYITVHVPKTSETAGMIGKEQFAIMKPNCRLINAARGGVINPADLLEALESGKVAGAGLDVWTKEPPESEAELKLIQHPNVLAVPHLGASTEEAQDQVALDAAQQIVEALSGGEVRNAVNAPGFGKAIPEALQPYTELATRMGTILTKITPGALNKVEVVYRGAIGELNITPITTYLLVGLLQPHMDAPVNVINAPVMAEERGVEIAQITSAKVKEFTNMMEVTIYTDQGKRNIRGTIFGNRFPRIIAIDGFRMEMKPEGHVLIISNDDQPGVVGKYGTILGNAKLNIADMTFARKLEPPKAMVGINLDAEPNQAVLDEIKSQKFVDAVYYLHLPILYTPGQAE